MRPILLGTVLALVGLAHSQGTLPTCAQTCVTEFTSGSSIGSCGAEDIKCICSNSGFLSSIACCLASKCSAADQAAAVAYAKEICTTAGVTVPDSVVCLSSSTATTSTSTTPVGTLSSASSSASSAAPVNTSTSALPAVSSTTSSAAASESASGSSTTATSASVSTTSSSAPATSATASATKNAGTQNAVGAGMSFVGGLAAMLALL